MYFPRCSHYSISCTHHFCSYPRRLLLSLFLAALSFSLPCQITSSNSQTLALLLSAALFLLCIQFVISCCIWLISLSLQLNHGFVLFSSKPHISSATLVSICICYSVPVGYVLFLLILSDVYPLVDTFSKYLLIICVLWFFPVYFSYTFSSACMSPCLFAGCNPYGF